MTQRNIIINATPITSVNIPNLAPFECGKTRYVSPRQWSYFLSHFQNPASSSHIAIIITQNTRQAQSMVLPPLPCLSYNPALSTGPALR
ncbi:MAG: hypothetical protein IMZ53_04395 [Thermoplasmata archaeon]|nr:hypothetical protein [Thermoplasmata archaeon]